MLDPAAEVMRGHSKGVSLRCTRELMPPSVGMGSQRYGVGVVVASAKDQRVGARMSASQPKTTRGRTW
jgi:hypothetical protein